MFPDSRKIQNLTQGAAILPAFALPYERGLSSAIAEIEKSAPFRFMTTPRGMAMSAGMTSAGAYGWVTDRRGYRYETRDPATGKPWPLMPEIFMELAMAAASAASFAGFIPDACLINRYAPKAKLSLHQDKDEKDFAAPIVSVSLGLPAVFLFGGANRTDPVKRFPLTHGDVVVWGGPARLNYHGVLPVKDGHHDFYGNSRINLTFRKAK